MLTEKIRMLTTAVRTLIFKIRMLAAQIRMLAAAVRALIFEIRRLAAQLSVLLCAIRRLAAEKTVLQFEISRLAVAIRKLLEASSKHIPGFSMPVIEMISLIFSFREMKTQMKKLTGVKSKEIETGSALLKGLILQPLLFTMLNAEC